jgi:hypothetical protein
MQPKVMPPPESFLFLLSLSSLSPPVPDERERMNEEEQISLTEGNEDNQENHDHKTYSSFPSFPSVQQNRTIKINHGDTENTESGGSFLLKFSFMAPCSPCLRG